MRRRRRILVLVGLVLVGLVGTFGMGADTYAANETEVIKKWAFVGYKQCVNANMLKTPIATKGKSGTVADKVMMKKGTVALPSYRFMHSANDSINCYDLFMGSNGFKGVLDYVGGNSKTVTWGDGTGTKELLNGKLGYNFQGQGEEYFTIVANRHDCTTVAVMGGGANCSDKTSSSVRVVSSGNGKYSVSGGFLENEFKDIKIETTNSALKVKLNTALGCRSSNPSVEVGFQKNISDFRAAVADKLNGLSWSESCAFDNVKEDVTFKFSTNAASAGQDGEYKYPGGAATLEKAIKAMSGQDLKSMTLDMSERYTLYTYYLDAAAKGEGGSINCDADSAETGSNFIKVKNIRSGGKFKECVVNLNGKDPSKIQVNDISKKPTIVTTDLSKVISWLNNKVDTNKLKNVENIEDIATASSAKPDTKDSESEPTCMSAGGANTLGWIVCSITEWLGDAAETAYSDYVEPSLQIDPKLFQGGDDGTREGWETFRNIANVIFVILFLLVIFSQLTGYGIDNYGIKKILPKLIVAAILINLSYWICLVFIDLSNILGNGFRAMFDALGSGLGKPKLDIEGATHVGDIGASGAILSVVVLGALVVMGGTVWANPAVVLSLLVAALGVVISVFFLFILLSVREAAIVVLTVLSPLAVVLYILPNTKGAVFDKWLKIFEGLLLVYPICGLLIGGGNYISKLLLSAGFAGNGYLEALTAMIVGIVPIFFIPAVLTKSFSAMGNLGAKISGIGQDVGKFATDRTRKSGAYQNLQQAGLERQTRRRGGLDSNGVPLQGWRRTLANIRSGGNTNRQRNAMQYRRMISERGALAAADQENFMLATQTANEMTRLEASGEINNIGDVGVQNSLANGLYRALLGNDAAQIRAYTDALSAKGEDGRNAVKSAWNAAVSATNPDGSSRLSAGAANTFGNNILNNHAAEYKNDARSMFEAAKQAAGAQSGFTRSDDRTNIIPAISGAKSSTMVSMDDTEFEQTYRDYLKEVDATDANGNPVLDENGNRVKTWETTDAWNNLDGDTRHAIQYQAYQAIQNNPNMKKKRFGGISALVQGYTPGPGEVLQVQQHGGTPLTI